MDSKEILSERLEELTNLKLDEDYRNTIPVQAKGIRIPYSTLIKYINGNTECPAKNIVKIARYYGVSTDYLLGVSNVKSIDAKLKGVCKYTNLTEKAVKLLNRCDKNKVVVLSKMIENYNFWAMIDRINKYGKISQQAYSDEIWLSDGDFNPTTDISVTKSAQEAQFLLFQIQKLMIKIVEEGVNNGEHTGKTE